MKRYIRSSEISNNPNDSKNLLRDAIENVLEIKYIGRNTFDLNDMYQHSDRYDRDIAYSFKRGRNGKLNRLEIYIRPEEVEGQRETWEDLTYIIAPMLRDMKQYLVSKYDVRVAVNPSYHIIDCYVD